MRVWVPPSFPSVSECLLVSSRQPLFCSPEAEDCKILLGWIQPYPTLIPLEKYSKLPGAKGLLLEGATVFKLLRTMPLEEGWASLWGKECAYLWFLHLPGTHTARLLANASGAAILTLLKSSPMVGIQWESVAKQGLTLFFFLRGEKSSGIYQGLKSWELLQL